MLRGLGDKQPAAVGAKPRNVVGLGAEAGGVFSWSCCGWAVMLGRDLATAGFLPVDVLAGYPPWMKAKRFVHNCSQLCLA